MFGFEKVVTITIRFSEIEGLHAFDNDYEGIEGLNSNVPMITEEEDKKLLVFKMDKCKLGRLTTRVKKYNDYCDTFNRPNWKAEIAEIVG